MVARLDSCVGGGSVGRLGERGAARLPGWAGVGGTSSAGPASECARWFKTLGDE
jgi:hypothetical protein